MAVVTTRTSFNIPAMRSIGCTPCEDELDIRLCSTDEQNLLPIHCLEMRNVSVRTRAELKLIPNQKSVERALQSH